MHSIAEALAIVQQQGQQYFAARSAANAANIESLELSPALLGRVLAADIHSPIAVPGFANSAMDGYVLRVDDLRYRNDSTEVSEPLAVSGEVAAGQSPLPLPPGVAWRIFTGAAIPEGGDVVVAQENCMADCTTEGTSVRVCGPRPPRHQHIRDQGLIFTRGASIATRGQVCTAEMLSALAAAGIAQLPIYRRLRLALCIAGDELVLPGKPLRYGQIYDSNQILLRTLALSCQLTACVRIGDNYAETQQQMHKLSQQADLLICSGGVSVGAKDYVQKVMLEQAQMHIRKVAIKPGKPFTFGALSTERQQPDCPTFCLPGNPLSVYICWQYFVTPFIHIVQGDLNYRHRLLHTPAPRDFSPKPRTQFLFGKMDADGAVQLCSEQSSAALQNLLQAEGALIVPANRQVLQGEKLDFFPFLQD